MELLAREGDDVGAVTLAIGAWHIDERPLVVDAQTLQAVAMQTADNLGGVAHHEIDVAQVLGVVEETGLHAGQGNRHGDLLQSGQWSQGGL